MGEVHGKLLGTYTSILYAYVHTLYTLASLWFTVHEDIHYTHPDRNRHVTSYYSCVYEFLMLISEHGNYIVNFLQILTKWKVHNLTCSCSQMLSLVSGYYVNAAGNIMSLIISGRKLPVHDLCHDPMCHFCYSSSPGLFPTLHDVSETVPVYT